MADTNIWERRSDLQGLTLVNLNLEYPPFNYWSEEEGKYSGFMSDILSELEDRLNFSVRHREPRDGLWAGRDESGKG